jgi:transglutaminase-like putative cysteine protease
MRKWWQLPEGWLNLPLLMLMTYIVLRSIQWAEWGRSLQVALGLLTPVALGGVLLGFLLARARWLPRVLAHVLGFLGGTAWIIHLSGSLRAVHPYDGTQVVSFLHPSLEGWKDLATELLLRFVFIGRNVARGGSGEDAAVFIILMAFVAWFLAFLSTWWTYRSRWPWAAVALLTVVLILNLVYSPQVAPAYFGWFAFFAIIYLIYFLWKQQELRWQKEQVRYPRELTEDVLRTGIILSAVLVLATAFLPTTAGSEGAAGFWERFLSPWRETRRAWERVFSDIGGSGESRMGEYAPAFDLGGARVAPEGVALEVRARRSEYLRSVTFDEYDGRGWANTADGGPSWNQPPREPLPLPRTRRVTVDQEITPRKQGGYKIFAYAEPISVSLPVEVEMGVPRAEGGLEDIVTVRSRTALASGSKYKVTSLLSVVDKTTLRQAGQQYPLWVTERYLQLPETLPQRVYDLGDEITAQDLELSELDPDAVEQEIIVQTREGDVTIHVEGGEIVDVVPQGALVRRELVSPYDATEAVQDYLRTSYPYREDISAPPMGVDAVDYFLFDGQAGYCDYFASSMVVLLRTQGVPARLVRGYAAGTYDADNRVWVIPISSAHSWVEVYFPEFGWQRFEPTAADYTALPNRPEEPPSTGGPQRTPGPQNPRDRDDMLPEEDISDVVGPGLEAPGPPFPWASVLVPGILILLGGGTVAGVVVWANRGLGGLEPSSATYERLCRWAGFVGLPPEENATPFEYADDLADTIPDQRGEIATIANLYVRERFGRHRPFPGEVVEVEQAWRGLRWPLLARLLHRVRRRGKTQAEETEE